MPISNWILGTCIDCKSETDLIKFDKFIGYFILVSISLYFTCKR